MDAENDMLFVYAPEPPSKIHHLLNMDKKMQTDHAK
jgi:hypothetical protein